MTNEEMKQYLKEYWKKNRVIRIPEELHRKYKAFCALHDLEMRETTAKLITKFLEEYNGK